MMSTYTIGKNVRPAYWLNRTATLVTVIEIYAISMATVPFKAKKIDTASSEESEN